MKILIKTFTRGHTVFTVQWHVNGYLNNLSYLEMLTNRHQSVVIALQKIHCDNAATMHNSPPSVPMVSKKTGDNIYQSADIDVSAEIPADQIDIETDLPIVRVRLPRPFPESVVSLYLFNGKLVDLKKSLEEIFRKITSHIGCEWPSLITRPYNNTRGSIVVGLAK